MKKNHYFNIILMLIVSLMLCVCSCKQIKGPAIKFKSMAYQFGEVEEGAEISHEFIFTNPGSEPLIITDVKPTCGCTIMGEYTKEVKPGKKGKIPLVLHTKGMRNDVIKTIRVLTNVPDAKEIAITLEGKVNVLLEISPPNLWLGNTKKDGPPLKGIFTLKSHIETPVKIIEVNPDADNVKAEVIPAIDGKEYTLEITVFPPFRQGHINEKIAITTDMEKKKNFDVTYQYYFPFDVEVNPQEVVIFKEQLQNDLVRDITIVSNIEKKIKPYDIHINVKNVAIETKTVAEGKHYRIMLKFTREFVFPENADIVVTFKVENAPGNAQYRVPVKPGGEWNSSSENSN